MKDLPPFANKAINENVLFTKNDSGKEVPNWKILEEFMSKEGPLLKA